MRVSRGSLYEGGGGRTCVLLQYHTARKLSTNLYDIHHCYVYSEKLLMMDGGTVRNV